LPTLEVRVVGREQNPNPQSLKLKVITVWRAFFFAVGTMLIIVGIECLLIDSATLSGGQTEAVSISNTWFGPQQIMAIEPQRVVQPPEWIRWSLIASGAVVLLYAMTLPRRWGGSEA
jgi:hypothetical protein